MEYVEGETLAARLAKGPLPLVQALQYAIEMASALDRAHRAGIVHRDIKPGNVMLTKEGTKLLDFGLAKTRAAAVMGGTTSVPTEADLTAPGMILGTVQYMAPEQVEGKSTDARTDIFALGAVLYEMVTGRKAFDGGSRARLMAAILEHDPPRLSSVQPRAPLSLDRIVGTCLAKDPDDRWQTARDLLRELEWATDGSSEQPAAPGKGVPPLWRRALPWGVTVIVLALAGAAWTMYGGAVSRPEARWQRYTQLTDLAGEEGAPSISPDGASIAYTSRARGSWDIYVQRVGGHNPLLVAGESEREESAPAFSPDGQRLAFHEEDGDGGIFIIGASGESLRRLTDAGFHPAWSPDGRSIVYCTEAILSPARRMGISTLWLVDLDGGSPRMIDDGDAVQPAWSPSGARIAFWTSYSYRSLASQRDLFTIPASGGERVPVLEDAPYDWSPAWSPDGRALYFASDRGGVPNLWRIAIDESTGRALGAPEPVTGGVQAAADLPSLSKDGTKLVYRSRMTTVNPVKAPFDAAAERVGAATPLLERTGMLSPKDVSPDGQWLALGNFGEPREDIFIVRTDGTDLRRLTDDEARDRAPTWSPDGRELAFYSNRGGSPQIWTIRSDGSRPTQRTDTTSGAMMFPVWSPTGDRMVASMPRAESATGFLWNVNAGWSSSKELPGLKTPEGWIRSKDWSPDGRRLTGGVQDASANIVGIGWYDINAGTSTVVSHDRSPTPTDVQWLPDSRRILFVNDKGELVLVDADTKRRKVLPTAWPFQIADESVALAPDGRTVYVGARKVESDIWMVAR